MINSLGVTTTIPPPNNSHGGGDNPANIRRRYSDNDCSFTAVSYSTNDCGAIDDIFTNNGDVISEIEAASDRFYPPPSPRRSYDSCGGDFARSSGSGGKETTPTAARWPKLSCDSAYPAAATKFSVNRSYEDVTATMLRFFSRRKAKGRAEQKVGAQSAARKPGGYGSHKNSKDWLQCNIILLDGSDLALEIGVRFFMLKLIVKLKFFTLQIWKHFNYLLMLCK